MFASFNLYYFNSSHNRNHLPKPKGAECAIGTAQSVRRKMHQYHIKIISTEKNH